MLWFKRREWNRGSADCSSCKVTEVDDTSTGFLDKTQHRCSSIASLLSIEQSLVTHDDKNRMMLVPLVCLQGNVPAEVNFSTNTIRQDENLNVQRVDDNSVHVETTIDNHINTNATSDVLEKISLSDSINDDIKTNDDDLDIDNPMSWGIRTKSLEVQRSSQRESKKKTVQFGSVEVHEHELTLCRSSVPLRGPPLGLGQSRVSYRKFESVDEHLYETYLGGGPRPFNQLHQPSEQRVDMYVMRWNETIEWLHLQLSAWPI